MIWLIIGVVALVIFKIIQDQVSGKKITYVDETGTQQTERLKKRESRRILAIEKPENFEITPEIADILDKFENTPSNIFLTGKAGTGKSTLLRYFRTTTKKNHAVVAPTGIAALNVQGQTIHSFFGFGIDITLNRVRYAQTDKLMIFRNLDTLIIDEISMVRADLLDCIDKSLKLNRRNNNPFGGVQIIAIGDPYQLPPVVREDGVKYFEQVYGGPHFSRSMAYRRGAFTKLELNKIYRQKDDYSFIEILNSIRTGDISQSLIDNLNTKSGKVPHPTSIKLVTKNDMARVINIQELRKLHGEEKIYTAQIVGDFNIKPTPTETELVLKQGARIMLLNNDKRGKWVNGDIGHIIELETNTVKVKFEDGTYDDVELNEWDNIKFVYDDETRKIEPEVIGKFIQLPLKLAWAMTIHKSQGKTYEHVHVDFGTGTFAPGQAYVALSRCTSLDGLTFEVPITKNDILIDESVKFFMGDLTEGNLIENVDAHLTKELEPQIQSKSGDVSKSDINKLMFFMQFPERYATKSKKASSKVKYAVSTFNKIRATLDPQTIRKFENALSRYQSRVH